MFIIMRRLLLCLLLLLEWHCQSISAFCWHHARRTTTTRAIKHHHPHSTTCTGGSLIYLLAARSATGKKQSFFSWWGKQRTSSSSSSMVHAPASAEEGLEQEKENNGEKDQSPIVNGSNKPNNINGTKSKEMVHQWTFTTSQDKATYYGLNTTRTHFLAFLNYSGIKEEKQNLSCSQWNLGDIGDDQREVWRDAWKQGRLLADRTDLFASYHSDSHANDDIKRGGFFDLMHLYTARFLNMLADAQDGRIDKVVLEWMETNYGKDATKQLAFENCKSLSKQEQLERLKHFASWFKQEMPYYRDVCTHCGASAKAEMAARAEGRSDASVLDLEDQEPDDQDSFFTPPKDVESFVGYIYPNSTELKGLSSRTELYQCHECTKFFRFPRYNHPSAIIQHGKGRCGEYSILIFHCFRALKWPVRWVVDWADHIWVEILLAEQDDEWIHVDPCEAAVDDVLLYESWGKQATYVMAFGTTTKIQDVTSTYTSASAATIQQRRTSKQNNGTSADVSYDKAMRSATQALEDGLAKLFNS